MMVSENNGKARLGAWQGLFKVGTVLTMVAVLTLAAGCPTPSTPPACTTDADCADNEDGSVCLVDAADDSNNACVACATDGDCAADAADDFRKGLQGALFCVANACAECRTGADCDDGEFCNGEETCADGACGDGAAPCEEGEECDEDNDSCVTCVDDTDCDDDLFCNGAETCVDGGCVVGTPPCAEGLMCDDEIDDCICDDNADCDDGDECTSDLCTSDSVCENTATECDDGEFCNGAETCDSDTGDCVDGDAPCVDGEICDEENDECDTQVSCAVDADCDDALFCTGDETCVDDLCVPGTTPCTANETCDEDNEVCSQDITIFVLTKEIDTIIGTSANETIRGAVKVSDSTLDAGDSIDGGGGVDRGEFSLSGDVDYAGLADIERVEEYFIRNATDDDTGSNFFSMSGSTGFTSLWSDRSSDPLVFKGMGSIVDIGLFSTDQNLTATFSDAALGSTSDSVMVSLNEAEFTFNASTDVFSGPMVIIRSSTGATAPTDGGPETIVINSTGDAPNGLAGIDDAGENDFKTLTIMGDQNLQLDSIGGSVTSVDSTALTGDLDIDTTGADANDITVTLGNGNNTVRVGTTDDDDTFTGGTATDNLIISGATFADTTLDAFENLEFDDTGATQITTVTFDLDSAPNVSQVTIDESGGNLTTVTGTNTSDNFTLLLDTADDLTLSGGGTLSPDGSLTGTSVTIQIAGSANSVTFNTANWALGNNTKLTLDSSLNAVTLGVANLFGGTAGTLATIDIEGDSTVNITATLSADATFTKLDASSSDFTGQLLMTAAASATDLEIRGGGGSDTLLGGGGADDIDGNDGGDNINGAGGDDTIDGGDNNDTIIGGPGADDLTGGSENDTFQHDHAADNGDDIKDLTIGSDFFEFVTTGLTSGDATAFAVGAAIGAAPLLSVTQAGAVTQVSGDATTPFYEFEQANLSLAVDFATATDTAIEAAAQALLDGNNFAASTAPLTFGAAGSFVFFFYEAASQGSGTDMVAILVTEDGSADYDVAELDVIAVFHNIAADALTATEIK